MAVSEQPNLALKGYLDFDPCICGFLSFVVEMPSLEVTDNMQWSKMALSSATCIFLGLQVNASN